MEIAAKKLCYNETTVDHLQKHVLQDYLKMVFTFLFEADTWKSALTDVLHDELSKSSPNNTYANLSKKIELIGLNAFSVDDLDMTAIMAILIFHHDDLRIKNRRNLRSLWFSIRDDRNELAGHSTANESDYEIFEWASVSLANLSKYVEFVKEHADANESERCAYGKTYRDKIKKAKLELARDYKAALQNKESDAALERALNKALHSENPNGEFSKIAQRFIQKGPDEREWANYFNWVRKAAKRGISSASEILADLYFEGSSAFGLEKDYERAAYYYEDAGIDNLKPSSQIMYASLHLRGLCENASQAKGESILEQCARRDGTNKILANAYFCGSVLEKDYEKAALFYRLVSPRQMCYPDWLNLASIYLNGLCPAASKADGEGILEEIRSHENEPFAGHSWCADQYRTEDGYLFYRFVDKGPVSAH